MHSFSHYDPFNNTPSYLFDNQEHYLQPATAFSPTSYATPHQFPVDPRWFNTSFSGHATSAPHQFSPMTHSVITPPQLSTDLLSLSPSSTITPIPPLSGSRNRSRSMSNRFRSFNNPNTRLARPSSASAHGGNSNTAKDCEAIDRLLLLSLLGWSQLTVTQHGYAVVPQHVISSLPDQSRT